jgi:uncharacterized membrane protein
VASGPNNVNNVANVAAPDHFHGQAGDAGPTALYTHGMADALFVFMRWLHLSSMATLVGGLLYARLAMTPAAGALPAEQSSKLGEKAAAAFRPLAVAAISGLVISGVYNVLSAPGHTVRYHMILGIKLLLVAHVFAVAILIVQPGNPRRTRLMTGGFISGLAIVLISAYLRRIF